MNKVIVEQHGLGIIWIAAWLFTIGFLKLQVLNAILAIILWPYYLGAHFAI